MSFKPANSYRDYIWWKNDEGTFGQSSNCSNELDMSGFRTENQHLGVPVQLYNCDTCVCSVDMNTIKNRNTDKIAITSVSITPQISDISRNMLSILLMAHYICL